MKKNLLILSLFSIVISSKGQHTLLSSEMLPFGSYSVQKTVSNLSVIDTTNQGLNRIWNFSAIQYSAVADLTVHIVNPTSTPYSSSFSNSNYGYKEVTGTTTNYRYFNLNSTLMERVGSYVSNTNIYSDPQIEYVFPLTLGTTNNDSWASTNSSTGGTYNLKCIGTGTLILPSGTYTALLVRVNVEESFIAFPVYAWYSADNGVQLLSYIVGDGFFIAPKGLVLSSISVGVNELEFVTEVKYINPFNDNFSMSFITKENKTVDYTIVNSLGQVIIKGKADNYNNEHIIHADMSSEANGIYFLTLQSSDTGLHEIKTIKLIKY